MNIDELAKALRKHPNQNAAVPELVCLMAENPQLPVVAMVDSEVVADDSCCWWYGSLGNAYVDEICVVRNRYNEIMTLQKSDDDWYDIFEHLWDYEEEGIDPDDMPEDEILRRVKEKIETLPWQRSICVEVTVPDKPPFDAL